MKRKRPHVSPVWKLHMMTYTMTPLREILLEKIASKEQKESALSEGVDIYE